MSQNNDTTKEKKWEQSKEVERYKIEGWIQAGHTASEIAKFLGNPHGRPPATVNET